MIFVRVGEHEPKQVAPLRDQERDVRHDQVDARKILAGEGHAQINRDPLALRPVANAVEREIHADLADAAKRREHELARHYMFLSPPPERGRSTCEACRGGGDAGGWRVPWGVL